MILHQGPRAELRKYSSDNQSETARRLTNLFSLPAPIAIDGRIFEENLIHRTNREEMVRSKSEVIIANELAHRKVEYGYEQPLTIDGVTKYPDFTIEDAEPGGTSTGNTAACCMCQVIGDVGKRSWPGTRRMVSYPMRKVEDQMEHSSSHATKPMGVSIRPRSIRS